MSLSRNLKLLFGAAGTTALLSASVIVSPALARGLVADANTQIKITTPCALTSCTTPLTLDGHNIYVYSDGVVSIDDPLSLSGFPASLSDLGSSKYVAGGLADYAGFGTPTTVSEASYIDAITNDPTLRIDYVFQTGGTDDVFGILLSVNTSGNIYGSVAYGLTDFGLSNANPPGCIAVNCGADGSSPDIIDAYLPPSALTGSSYAADVVVFDPVPTAAAVPEPATWAIMGFGICAMGGLMRRSKKTVA